MATILYAKTSFLAYVKHFRCMSESYEDNYILGKSVTSGGQSLAMKKKRLYFKNYGRYWYGLYYQHI